MTHRARQVALSALFATLPLSFSVQAQDASLTLFNFQNSPSGSSQINKLISGLAAPTSLLSPGQSLLRVERELEPKDFQGLMVDETLNFNLGVELSPFKGFNFRADAWRLEIDEVQADSVGLSDNLRSPLLAAYFEETVSARSYLDSNFLSPYSSNGFESNGIDLGASYRWDSSKFGRFTVSTKASYVYDYDFSTNNNSVLDFSQVDLREVSDRTSSPELQSSLMLTWQFGNHTASAITNYVESVKDLNDMDLDEINDLVDDIATFDLQYGYSVNTRSNDKAIFSFGIRNVFDEKTNQILNSDTRIMDQNGRVAYGSIKYQF